MTQPTPSQQRAIAADGNVLVIAGAGTGKTRTLVERCLARVCDAANPVSLDRLLVVTFTEAAAAEIRKRLREELEKRAVAQPDNHWLAEQSALVETARISTLHSFCLQVVREHFHELGLDPQLAVLAEAQTRLLARETLDRLMEKHYAGGTAVAEAVRQLIMEHGRGWDQPIRELVLRVHHYTQTLRDPDGWFSQQLALLEQPFPETWERWLREGFREWSEGWLSILQEQPPENTNAHRCARALSELTRETTREEIAAALAQIAEADQEWPRGKKGAFRDPIDAFFVDAEFLLSVTALSNGVDPLLEDWGWVRPPMTALVQLAREFSQDFARDKRELAAVDFHDLEQFALKLLWDRSTDGPSATARQWRAKLALVFVDEYQDINEAQDTILRALGREGVEANRFLVGDVKQSIYRFRLANPRIFQRYAEDWKGTPAEIAGPESVPNPISDSSIGNQTADRPGRLTSISASPPPLVKPTSQVISLSDNFRSHERILQFVNALFAALMRQDIGGVDYDQQHWLKFGTAADRPYFSATVPAERSAATTAASSRACSSRAAAADPPAHEAENKQNPARPGAQANELTARVELHLGLSGNDEAEPGDDSADDLANLSSAEKEARLAAARLRELKRQGLQIWDTVASQPRPVAWRDMAILLRSPRGKAEIYAKAFAEFGVPLLAAPGGFFDCMEITDLLSLLQVLDNPLQDLPLLATLRSPLVGLTLDQLATIRSAHRRGYFWTALRRFYSDEGRGGGERTARSENATGQTDVPSVEREAGRQQVGLFLKRIAIWRELARQVPLSQCLEAVLDETHYQAWLLAQPRGAQRRSNVQRLLALTRQFDQFHRQGLFRFLKFVEAQLEAGVDTEPAALSTEDAVRLISIHQSKGLEFPVVVVADLGKRFNFDDLKERVILDEAFGLCPKVKPPHTGQLYPSLPYWVAKRRQRRETLGEELRLLYVALTRACDKLILTGTMSAKTAAEKWSAGVTGVAARRRILEANSCLDWFGCWLPGAVGHADWTTGGQSGLLTWTVHHGDDPQSVQRTALTGPAPEPTDIPTAIDSATLSSLERRLGWRYGFDAATREPAKTSVSALRRRLRDETDDEARSMFPASGPKFQVEPRAGRTHRQLTAAEIGTAHHRFLEMLSLDCVGSVDQLRTEAERLQSEALLSGDETEALDLAAVAAFWQSEPGRRILAHRSHVHREIPFTARFGPEELAQINLLSETAELSGEFFVVQGFADLAVILPEELWLVDFKTEAVSGSELEVKRADYERQLKLYGLALQRIYHRPATELWLHFFKSRRTVPIATGASRAVRNT